MKEEPLDAVFDFLARTGVEVEGRTSETPPAEIQQRLRHFATGRGNEHERSELCDLLRTRPGWLQWMVDVVKSERADATGSAQAS